MVQVGGFHVVGDYEQYVWPGIYHLGEAPLCLAGVMPFGFEVGNSFPTVSLNFGE
jgi:hypothetical protein